MTQNKSVGLYYVQYLKGDSLLEYPVRHAQFWNIFQPGDHISKGMRLCFVVIQSTMGRLCKAMVSSSDLFFLCEIDGKIVVCRTGCRDILRAMLPFSVYFIRKWFLPQENLWLYCFIVVLWDDHETKINFTCVWTTEWKITPKCQNFLVRNRPEVIVDGTCALSYVAHSVLFVHAVTLDV